MKRRLNRTAKNVVFIHIPLLVLLLLLILYPFTIKSARIDLIENVPIKFDDILARLKLKKGNTSAVLNLKKFSISRYSFPSNSVKSYISEVELTSDNKITLHEISVNRPMKAGNIMFYQNNWSLGIKKIRIKINGREYGFNSILNTRINDDTVFKLAPFDISDKNSLMYEYMFFDKSKGTVIDQGIINGNENIRPDSLLKKYAFSVISEDFSLVSVLEAYYKPFDRFIIAASLIFLVLIAFNFLTAKKLRGDNAC